MYGWRGRIGIILPADNVVLEPEYYALGLPGLSFHTARLTATDHDEMRAEAPRIASSLAEAGVDVIAYACGETSFDAGRSATRTLTAELSAQTGVPTVSATDALLASLSRTKADSIALVTPYRQQSGSLLERLLQDTGHSVAGAIHRDFSIESSDSREWWATNRQSSATTYQMLSAVNCPQADALVVCATNLASLAILEQAELDFGKPVLSSNQAILLWCLEAIGVRAPVPGLGSLMRAES